MTLDVTEYTDPACPWAWGSEPTLGRLRELLGVTPVRWRRVFGILFDEDDDPPPDVEAETAWYRRHLAEIATHTGAPTPRHLQWVCRTSWPASLAAVAARAQGEDVAARVLRRLRESTFILGTPADSRDGVLAALRDVPGLDLDRLGDDLDSAAVRAEVRRGHAEARAPVPEAFTAGGTGPHPGQPKPAGDGYRYALPTLVFSGARGRAVVAGWHTLTDYLAAARQVAPEVPTP